MKDLNYLLDLTMVFWNLKEDTLRDILLRYSYFKLLDDPNTTMGVGFNPEAMKFEIQVGTYYLNKSSDTLLIIVVLHELCHIILGHCAICSKKFVELYPKYNSSILNIAMDYQVNGYIEEIWDRIKGSLCLKHIDVRKLIEENKMYIPKEGTPCKSFYEYLEDVKRQEKDIVAPSPDGKSQDGKTIQAPGNHAPMNKGMSESDKILAPAAIQDVEKEIATKENSKGTPNKAGIYSGSSRKTIEKSTSKSKYMLNIDIHIGLKKMIGRISEEQNFKKPTLCSILGITEGIIQGQPKRQMPNICFFCDVSGSMSLESLRMAYPYMTEVLGKVGTLWYCMCDTEIIKKGRLPDKKVFDDAYSGGGTNFDNAVKEMHIKHSINHFIFYSDGQVPQFKLPPEVTSMWLLVDKEGRQNWMEGTIIQVGDQK